MKERERVANTFTSIASGWNQKGNIIASCTGQKNPFKTEYPSWIHDGMKILDVGCGAGKNLLRIDSQYNNCELMGIDISDKMIEIASNHSTSGENQVKFVKSDIMDFDADTKYDVITFNYVLHHVSDPQKVIEKASSLLANGGIIMVTVPGTEYLKEIFAYSEEIPSDVIGRFSKKKVENFFSIPGMVQLTYKKSVFLMRFESYDRYVEYLKSIGTYQKIVGYYEKNWSTEFNQLILTAFSRTRYITGHYDLYVYCKLD